MGRLRGGGRERARGRARPGRPRLSTGLGRGSRPGDRGISTLAGVIDVKAARAEPDSWRAALARKGAAEEFDALMEADRSWLALVPQVDDLRSKTKLKGKPTPEQLEELRGVKAELQRLEEELAEAERRRTVLLDRVPNPPDPSAPEGS